MFFERATCIKSEKLEAALTACPEFVPTMVESPEQELFKRCMDCQEITEEFLDSIDVELLLKVGPSLDSFCKVYGGEPAFKELDKSFFKVKMNAPRRGRRLFS